MAKSDGEVERRRARPGSKRRRERPRRRESPRRPRSSAAAARSDKSVEAFREALERSVTLSRDRMQEVVDDAVKRGRMTRGDANELVSSLVTRGRQQTDDLMRDLERLLEQARKELDSRLAARRRRRADAGRRPCGAASPATPPTARWPRPTGCAAAPAVPRCPITGLRPAHGRAGQDAPRPT